MKSVEQIAQAFLSKIPPDADSIICELLAVC